MTLPVVSGHVMLVKEAIQRLRQAKKNQRCSDVRRLLKEFGFVVRDGNKGGHKTFTHPYLSDFHGGGFDCGHGKDDFVKFWYIDTILEILEEFEDELNNYIANC